MGEFWLRGNEITYGISIIYADWLTNGPVAPSSISPGSDSPYCHCIAYRPDGSGPAAPLPWPVEPVAVLVVMPAERYQGYM